MIHGYLSPPPGRRRPFVEAQVSIPLLGISANLRFLVDTGADTTLIAPADASLLEIDIGKLRRGPNSRGVGGTAETRSAEATLSFQDRSFPVNLRFLAPRTPRQAEALQFMPSLLGRDVLSQFALFFEERTGKVLLLDPDESDALSLT